MSAQPIAVYPDSNAIIRFVEGHDEGFAVLAALSDAGSIELHTSELTLAEVLVAPIRDRNRRLVAHYEELLSVGGGILVEPVGRSILLQSAENRAHLGNKGADAIHVATAGRVGCTVVTSSDKRIRLPVSMTRVAVEDVVGWARRR